MEFSSSFLEVPSVDKLYMKKHVAADKWEKPYVMMNHLKRSPLVAHKKKLNL